MGLTIDQIEGNAEELGAKLKELADNDVGGKMGASLGTARGQMDEMSELRPRRESRRWRTWSVPTQDLAALGGVAGTAGVALGQIASTRRTPRSARRSSVPGADEHGEGGRAKMAADGARRPAPSGRTWKA